MLINIDNNEIAKMVSNHVKDEVRKRIKEMQGGYTSKGFIENIIRDTVWDKIHELCPDVEDYLRNETIRCIDDNIKSRNTKLKAIKLLEKCAEEIENLYGRETELSNKVRDFLNK